MFTSSANYHPYPTSLFDIPDESLDAFMAQMVVDLALDAHSPSSEAWISQSPSPTICHDPGVHFHAAGAGPGDPLIAPRTNQLHHALVSDFAHDLRQSLFNVDRPGPSPGNLSHYNPLSDVSWPTNLGYVPGHGEVSVTPAMRNHYKTPVRTISPVIPSQELSTTGIYHIKPTCLLPNYNGIDTHDRHDSSSYQRDPRAMRECLMFQAEGKPLNEAFRKSAKDIVASPNTRRASSARRKYAAKFRCPIDGCNDDFTRKHNLDNHLRSHCGITDLMCDICHQGFTTIPVWKRHKRNCRHPSFPPQFL